MPKAAPGRTAYEDEMRERIARVVFFASNDGVEYDTPKNDPMWEHWRSQDSEVEAWRAADAIIAGPLARLQADLTAAEAEIASLRLRVREVEDNHGA